MTFHHAHQLVQLAASAAAPHGGGNFQDAIVSFFKDGGPFMYVNVFWLACAVAVIIERIITLMFRYNLNAPPFMEQVTKLVLTGNVDRAVKLCGAAPHAPLAKVIRAGLTRANRGEMEVANREDSHGSSEFKVQSSKLRGQGQFLEPNDETAENTNRPNQKSD